MNSITLPIILITAAISVLAFNQPNIMSRFQFNPWMVANRGQWYRFLTHGFLHADWLHLIINMLVLYSFGQFVEFKLFLFFGDLGTFIYAGMYIAAIIIASISTYFKQKENHYYNAVGASGAVSAVIFSSVVFSPFMEIRLYGIIPLPALVWAVLYVLYSAYMGKRGGDNVNHEAHLWGGFFGTLLTLLLSPAIARDFLTQLMYVFR